MITFQLAIKEMLRNKFRFIVIAMIVALITLLVILQLAMAEGLTVSSSQYITGIDAELMLFRDTAKKVIPASGLGYSELKSFRRVKGVKSVGPIGFSTSSILINDGNSINKIDVALIGIEPGMPGAPSAYTGMDLADERAMEVVLDKNLVDMVFIPIGSTITLQVVQGLDEVVYELKVVGHTDAKKYSLPSIFVPIRVWDQIKPKEKRGGGGEIIFNVAAVKLEKPETWKQMIGTIEQQAHRIEATDLITAYRSLPGYSEMQGIMDMMQGFVTLVAMLVIGVFFQIQAMQKITHVGMLKAIGASNRLVISTLLTQVMLITFAGIAIGGVSAWAIATSLPPTVTVIFNGQKVIFGLVTLFLIGPLASFFAVRTLLKVEPLKALGLAR